LKCLRTNRGGGFCNNELLQYCKYYGVRRQLTAAYTPQQNGVVEHKKRTLANMIRSMLKTKGLSNNDWFEAIRTTIYILNRCPTYILDGITILRRGMIKD